MINFRNRFAVYVPFSFVCLLPLLLSSCGTHNIFLKSSRKFSELSNIAHLEPFDNIRQIQDIASTRTIDSLAEISRRVMFSAINHNYSLLPISRHIPIKSIDKYLDTREEVIEIIRKIENNKKSFGEIQIPKAILDIAGNNKYIMATYQQGCLRADALIIKNNLIDRITAVVYNPNPAELNTHISKLVVMIFDIERNNLAFYSSSELQDVNQLNPEVLAEQYATIIRQYRDVIERGRK